jgi:hypothetical protein
MHTGSGSELAEFRREVTRIGRSMAVLAADTAMFEYTSGNIPDEEHLTGALCGAMAAAKRLPEFSGGAAAQVQMAVAHKILQERHIGADLLITFASGDEDWPIRTRMLLQAKRAEPDHRMSASEWDRMQQQVRTMMSVAQEAFVMVYSKTNGICVLPAISVAACKSRQLFDLEWYRSPGFIEGVFGGFIGEKPSSIPIAPENIGDPVPGWGASYELHILVSSMRQDPKEHCQEMAC